MGGYFLVADTPLHTLPCRWVGKLVGRFVTFLNSERFLHYCSCPTVRDWIAVYPALFLFLLTFLFFFLFLPFLMIFSFLLFFLSFCLSVFLPFFLSSFLPSFLTFFFRTQLKAKVVRLLS